MKFDAKATSEMKYAINIFEENISQRSYFTLRSNISHAERRISLKRAPILIQDWCSFLAEGVGFYPRTKKRATGTLFALCGAPSCSNPHALGRTQKTAPTYGWYGFFCGGGSGIRTHAPFRTNGFQDRLVMTTSISLHITRTKVRVSF